jgi:predicted 3-demethylubiquinone-9 3-methyltransferase (glyoxalase superfamily)
MAEIHQKIVPHLWFDHQADEAVHYYVSLFPESELTGSVVLPATPSGDAEVFSFTLLGSRFMAINGGPLFRINPSVSFFVYCGSDREIERLYEELSNDGEVMFPLDSYPWARRYAFIQDRFGVAWQLDADPIVSAQKIVPTILLGGTKGGMVREAMSFWSGCFPDSRILLEARADPSTGLPEGSLLFAQFKLGGYLLNAMSSPLDHGYDFNEAVSLMVECSSQEEIDDFWQKLGAGGSEQPCGWLKDRFGLSWQVVPAEMNDLMFQSGSEKLERILRVLLPMKKLDLEALRNA